MPTFPDYRVRLFLSADIVGSTAFKAGRGKKPGQDQTTPSWVSVTRDLYVTFARRLKDSFAGTCHGTGTDAPDGGPPLLWKIIGDEVVFCCRLADLRHLAHCLTAFIETLHAYTDRIRGMDVDLSMKGSGWVAAFPSVNVLVPLSAPAPRDGEYLAVEADERRADLDPHEFEFLGTDIDAGFRIGAFATESRFATTCGLAVLAADACRLGLCDLRFDYHGRTPLKGVIGGQAYPVVTIDMERDPRKIAVRDYERAMTGAAGVDPSALANFLRAFMHDGYMDLPLLGTGNAGTSPRTYPRHYNTYRQAWTAALRSAGLEARAEGGNSSGSG